LEGVWFIFSVKGKTLQLILCQNENLIKVACQGDRKEYFSIGFFWMILSDWPNIIKLFPPHPAK